MLESCLIGDMQSAAPRLKWLWLKEINLCAAEGGHVDVLQWLRVQVHLVMGTCTAAAGSEHVAVLRWA